MAENGTKETKALSAIEQIKHTLSLPATMAEFKAALPPQVDVEKFRRVALTAIERNPELVNADRASLYLAIKSCAQDGLLPDNREAALVIIGGKAVYFPMIGGVLKKVRNSGELASITSQVVHKNDKFRYWVDSDGEHIEHEPLVFGDRGDTLGVYALAKTKDGAVYIETMDKTQVMAVRSVAKSKNVWDGPFGEEMWRKSAIRRLSKRLPMSTDLERVIQRDDELYDLNKKPAEAEPAPAKTTRLDKIVDSAPKATPAIVPEVIDPAGTAQEPVDGVPI